MPDTRTISWIKLPVVFLWAIVLTVYLFSYIITDPAHMIITHEGDGPKNYFTYLYHILYGHGVWFTGMNYPYGEHIVYTDAMPLLAVPLARLHLNAQQALAFLHIFMACNCVLAILFVYKILSRFGVNYFLSVLGSGLIVLCAPQIFRIEGHFALSYLSFIPMLFYWTIRYNDTHQLRYPVYVFLLSVAFSFLHPYFAAIALVWSGFYALGYVLLTRGTLKLKLRHATFILAAAIATLAVIKIFMSVTDPVKDRPGYPYGLTTGYSHIKDMLSSNKSPVWQWVSQNKNLNIKSISTGGEGYAYIGIAALLILCGSALALSFRQNRSTIAQVSGAKFSIIWLFIAAGALLLAMGVPFIWNMEWLFDYISVFRQFRSMGRFSWIFYFIITVYSVVMLHRWYLVLRFRNIPLPAAAMVVLIPLAIWIYEASGNTSYIRHIASLGREDYKVYFVNKESSWPLFLQEHRHKAEDYQGMLLFPFFHIGSEKLWVRGNSGWLTYLGTKAALQLRLPVVDVMLSRSSWSQTEAQVRIAAGPYSDKPLLRYGEGKPFLLLKFEVDSVNHDEWYVLNQACDYMGHFLQCDVYSFYPDRLKQSDSAARANAISIASSMTTGMDSCVHYTGPWLVQHWDEKKNRQVFFGTGAATPIQNPEEEVYSFDFTPARDSQLYEFSTWFLVGDFDYSSPEMMLEMQDSSGNKIAEQLVRTNESLDNKGLWFRAASFFRIPATCRRIHCKLLTYNRKRAYLSMDETMLRPADALIISKSIQGIMANNHLLY